MNKTAIRHGLKLDAADQALLGRYYIVALKRGNGQLSPFARTKTAPLRVTALARLICEPSSEQVVDHINGNPWDNRRANLRVCKQADNLRNARISRGHSVGLKGVSRAPSGRFCAGIKACDRRIHLGTFDTAMEAGRAYDSAARVHFGTFAALNFPQNGEQSAHRPVGETGRG